MANTNQLGVVEVQGKPYPFAALDALGVRDSYERWMKASAWDELERLKGIVKPERWAAMELQLTRDMLAGMHSWGGPIFDSKYQTVEGQKKLLGFMFELANPMYDRTVVDQIYSSQAEADRVVNYMLKFGFDPNSQGAAAKEPPPGN